MMQIVRVLLQPFLTACNAFFSHKKPSSQNPPTGCHFEAVVLSLIVIQKSPPSVSCSMQ